ncbi:MAG TPA: hypothetical protein VFR26_10805, partial [Acidimicrobiales bacterium]|nr:hypothetical protein [Acidimicrobiales bacterium]
VFFLAILDELGRRSAAVEAAEPAEPAAPTAPAEDADSARVDETGTEPERPTPERAGVPGYVRAD